MTFPVNFKLIKDHFFLCCNRTFPVIKHLICVHNRKLLPFFIIKKEEDLNDPTLSRCRAALPGIPVLYDTFTENINTLGRRMYVDPEKLPLLLLLKPGLLGIYGTSGYHVGSVELALKLLEYNQQMEKM